MRYLLDTPVFLWRLADDRRLERPIADAIAEPGNEIHVSAVTAWEIVIEVSLGRLRFPVEELAERIDEQSFTALPVTIAHTQAVARLPPVHRDPFDRMLVAQAQSEQLALLTQDERVRDYLARA